MTRVLMGILAKRVWVSSMRSGINDSIPSNDIPSLIFSSSSLALGRLSLSSSACALIVGVIRNSRHGKISTLPITGAKVRWSETSK